MTPFDPNKITFFAKTDARGQNIPFGIKAIDRTKHMYVIGKTGMGKSTLLENMAVQDIRNGEGLAFIDPHGATAETLLSYIPEERKDDVLYFAPFDTEYPVAFNVMEDVGPDKRHLVVSGLMSVFKKIWVDAWSARMEYILQNTLLALLEYPDSTLLGVNRMLSDKVYRRKVIDNISDPAVKSFWVDEFLNYNERYMQEAGDAIKNKIGQFTANPLIRNIIGQPKSSFDLRKIMDEQKIVIMNLSKGLVGESNANLLGSMLTTRIYLAAMSRADLTPDQMKQMPNFYFYVDEFQSFANATFADILSEARKYKLNLTIAHQYIEQMEEEVKNAVFGNVGTIASFRVGPFDAEVLETIFAPQFTAIDICNLGFAQVYLTLMIDGVGSQPFSAATLPPLEKPSVSSRDIIIHASRKQFAHGRADVETAITEWHEPPKNGGHADRNGGNQGNGGNKKGASSENGQRNSDRSHNGNSNRKQNHNGNNGGNTTNNHSNRRDKAEDNGGGSNRGQSERNGHKGTENSKGLDELRAVLANISKQSDEKTISNISSGKSRNEESKKADTNKREKKSAVGTDAEVPLKQALADVLDAHAVEHTAIEGVEEKLHYTPKTKQPLPEPAAPVPEVQSQSKQQQLQTQSPQHADVQVSTKKDPLDPKTLERMMRARSDDRTPLK